MGLAAGVAHLCTPPNAASSERMSRSNNTAPYDVVVIGGGIAGLTCSYNLRDLNILVLEKNPVVGGRAVSGTYKSFSYARGTEYLGTPESLLKDTVRKLGLSLQEIPSPMDAYFDGKQFYYGGDGIKRYYITNSNKAAYSNFIRLIMSAYENYTEIPDLEYNAQVQALDNITAAEWLRKHAIPDVFINKYNVTTKGLFGATMDEISALSFIPEAAYDFEGIDASDMNVDDYAKFNSEDLFEEYAEAKKQSSGSYSFVKGITELTDKLGEVLQDKIRLGCMATKLVKQNKHYKIYFTDKNGNACSVLATRVVLATPAPVTLKIASEVLSKEKQDIMSTVHYSSYVTIALFSDTPIFDKAFDLAVPDEYFFTDVYDATWVERHYVKAKQSTKEYIASVYIGPKSAYDHSLDRMDDQNLLQNVYQDLNKVSPGASKKVTDYAIERFHYAYPIMSLGAYKRLLDLNNLNTGSIILAGDYMAYPTFEAAMQSGQLAAERVFEDRN